MRMRQTERELTEAELYDKAAGWCARAEHCASETALKLRQWGCTDSSVQERITERLREEGYINDMRYCRAFVHDKTAYQGWGRLKTRAMLWAKGLDEAAIEAALADTDKDDYDKALRKAAAKYGAADKERAVRFMTQRGFTYEEALRMTDGKE